MARFTILAGLLLAAALAPLPAADKAAVLSSKEIYQKVLKSAVWIVHAVEVEGGIAFKTGSGSLIDVEQRLVLTNHHVVGNQAAVAVFFPQYDANKKLIAARDHYVQQARAKNVVKGVVLHRDAKRDLAIVKLPSLPPGVASVPLARESVGPGDSVHSIGNPGASGALWAYSPGSVKAVYPKRWEVMDRDEGRAYRYEAQVVETTSPVNPGDSGGPLVNGSAELVGVTQGGAISQNAISFFIDISEVRTVLKEKKIRISNAPAAVVANSDPKDETKAGTPSTADADRLENTAQNKLNFAEQYRDRPSKYKEKLEEVIKLYPTTKAAKQAKDILAKLKT